MIALPDRSYLAHLARSLVFLVLLLCAASCFPVAAQSPSGVAATDDQTVIACPSWEPTWESTPLPNGRPQPYIRIPLDKSAFRGNVLGPVLINNPPEVQLYLRDADGGLTPILISKEIAGPLDPAPASVRVFWNDLPGGFPADSRMVVRLQVRVAGPGSGERPNILDEWLSYILPGRIPTIDRSSPGPAQASGSGNYVPNQQLLNGSKVPAFHASVRLGLASLSPNPQSDRIYIVSDNLLSSRSQDDSTNIRLAAGVVHSLPTNELDISPNISGEAWVQSNQAASNQASGISFGRLVLGRHWSGPIGHDFLYAALTPQFQLYPMQYTYLFRRDLRLDPGFKEKSFVDPSAGIFLSPIFIGLKRGQTATIESTANLSLGVRGWWVSGLGPEYRYVVRVQVPVRVWFLSGVGISYFRGADENAYFRYSNGVSFDFSFKRGKLF